MKKRCQKVHKTNTTENNYRSTIAYLLYLCRLSFIECYKTNNEVVFVNIPIKYNNEQCPTQDVGIRFTKGGKNYSSQYAIFIR